MSHFACRLSACALSVAICANCRLARPAIVDHHRHSKLYKRRPCDVASRNCFSVMTTARILLVDGTAIRVRRRDVLLLVLDRNVLAYFALTGVIIGILRRNNIVLDALPWWGVCLAVLLTGTTLIAGHFMTIYAAVGSGVFVRLPLVEPLLFLIWTLLSTFIAAAAISLTFGLPHLTEPDILGLAFGDYLHLIGFNYLFVRFVMPTTEAWRHVMRMNSRPGQRPRVSADTARPPVERGDALPPENAQPQPEEAGGRLHAQPVPCSDGEVELGGVQFPIGKITHIRSEDHYLHVHLTDQRTMVRCRLADAANALPEILGMCVHRSYWVRYTSISSVRRNSDGTLTLVLAYGETVPVSRGRRKAFLDAYPAYTNNRGLN